MPGTHAGARHTWRTAAIVVAVLLALGIGAGAALKLRLSTDSVMGSSQCDATTVEVAVVPALERAAKAAAESVGDQCRSIQVVRRTTAQVVADAKAGAGLPDLWIPDTSWPLQELYASGENTTVIADALASTPVVLVGGPNGAEAGNWSAALASGAVAMPDPMVSTVGTMALVAPEAEARQIGRTVIEARQSLVPLAQAFAERRADGVANDIALGTISATDTRVVPATEQEFIAAQRSNDGLRPVDSGAGGLLMTFPLVARGSAGTEVLQIGRDLADWFDSRRGQRGLRADGLRAPDGKAPIPGGVGRVRYLPLPKATAVQADVRSWKIFSVPSSLLAVFDVSGSMDFQAGDRTRIQLASGVAQTALKILPDHARVGLWVFSINQGRHGQDWRILAPVRRLDAPVRSATQRALLERWSNRFGDLTTGGTGLYDTAIAAYRNAVRAYDPHYANTVILLTDGANDDATTISLDKLLRELKAAQDPQRPVRIIGIAISQDADFEALQSIAQATGGEAYLAEQPEDVIKVFAQAIASR